MFLNVGMKVKDDQDNYYLLDEIIGKGGFGYVFKAHRERDNNVYAVKTTFPSFASLDSELSFKNEINSASKVRGANVIRYEFVHDGSLFPEMPPYIIMEYAEGGTLTGLISQQKKTGDFFSNDQLIDMFLQLAEGMANVNELLIHRDIKPDNILICNDRLKISDFGLSKIAAESTRTHSFKGGGTPLYMAPEAWDFSKNTIQMDMYSMGIVFFEMATFRYPYIEVPKTYDECKDMHYFSAITNPSKINSFLSPSLASIICRMLEKAPKRRFESWSDIINLLKKQTVPSSTIDRIIATAVAAKNTEDEARQQREAAIEKQKKDRDRHFKLVHSQFEQAIIEPVIEYAEKINEQYAGKDKLSFYDTQSDSRSQKFFWTLRIPPHNSLTFKFEVIFKENFTREVCIDRFFGDNRKRTEHYIPQYNYKNILGWGEITNSFGYGLNILLLDSGDIYGDWILMNNKNNLSCIAGNERCEPFAFSLAELPSEIDKVQVTHLYRTDFVSYDVDDYIGIINELAFSHIK